MAEAVRTAEETQRTAQVNATRMQAELEQAHATAKRDTQRAAEGQEEADQRLSACQQEKDEAAAELQERAVQLSVLSDTLEALQAGTSSEKEQRIVNLTAELVAGRVKEAGLERRVAALHDSNRREKQGAVGSAAQQQAAETRCKEAQAAEVAARQQLEQAQSSITSLRRELQQSEAAQSAAIEQRDRAHFQRAEAESEVAGLHEAAQRAAATHAEQLSQERSAVRERRALADSCSWHSGGSALEPHYMVALRKQLGELHQAVLDAHDAGAPWHNLCSCALIALFGAAARSCLICVVGALHRQVHLGSVLSALPKEPLSPVQQACACMITLLVMMGHKAYHRMAAHYSRKQQSTAGSESWQAHVVQQLQDMMLSAEAQRSQAVTTARIASEDAAALNARLRASEHAHLAAVHGADAAAAELAAHKASAQQCQEQTTQQHSERVAAHMQRISALTQQLEDRNAHLLQLTADTQVAQESAQENQRLADELSQALKSAQADLQEVTAHRDGLQMELAGAPEGQAIGRDAAVHEYVSSRVVLLLQYGCALRLTAHLLFGAFIALPLHTVCHVCKPFSLSQTLHAPTCRYFGTA